MAYIKTLDLLAALKTAITAIKSPLDASKPLFASVAFYDSNELGKALSELVIATQSACIILPRGDTYLNKMEGRSTLSERTSEVELILVDRSYGKGSDEAKFGGEKNVGVVTMKELVLEAIAGNSTLGLSYVALRPT
ncbi:MAG TPA: hypothetical protein VFE25_08270, partial [Opitutaceae bacterium]|nr:hypothetical protein [Opitutaceae bacterium]